MLKAFGFAEFKVELSTWDPKDKKSYVGEEAHWETAVGSLKKVLTAKGIAYREIPGEAAYHRNNSPERVPIAAKTSSAQNARK